MINVLVVDDSKFVVHAMESILEDLQYRVAESHTMALKQSRNIWIALPM